MLIRFLLTIAVILTMSGCQSTPLSQPKPTGPAFTDPDAPHNQSRRQRAQALFDMGDYVQAESALAELSQWQPQDLLLQAQICDQLENYQCSADAYIQAEIALPAQSAELPLDLHDRIWSALSRARQAPVAYADGEHHAWWLLQQQIRSAGSIVAQTNAWRSWRERYPDHPAATQPPRALAKLDDYRPPQLGVFLPLSGQFAVAGLAVRDGLVAAYLGEAGGQKPHVKFYDSGSEALGTLYERALADGVEVLVGPLIKGEVERFAELTAYAETPRLVLNYLTEPPGASETLFQFGIAIEDEATALANHVLDRGAQRLMVVHSEARWSLRALTAFEEQWPYPVTAAGFANIKQLTEAVGEAMQVAASEDRKAEISRILGASLEFLPRGRKDLDGVVALTNQIEAQALVPALRFHFADRLPVYATSQVSRGDAVADLAGFETTEMPVFSTPDPRQQALSEAFDLPRNPLGELYALGFDAYRLATWLPILERDSLLLVNGATGLLWLEPGGKFRRDLPVTQIARSGARVPIQ